MQAAKREMKMDKHMPMIMAGDINKEQSTLDSVQELKGRRRGST